MQETDTSPAPYVMPDDWLGAPWLRRHADGLIAAAVFVLTTAGAVGMMPPSRYPELAYVFAAPAVFWAYRAPSWKRFLGVTIGGQMLAWTLTLGWLSNVTEVTRASGGGSSTCWRVVHHARAFRR